MSNVSFLNAESPLFEMSQESDLYQRTKKNNAERLAFVLEIEKEFGFNDHFAFRDNHFGLEIGSEAEQKYEASLTKGDWYGYRKFRKASKEYKKLLSLYQKHCHTFVNPFDNLDAFGLNNGTVTQWVGDRWFITVRDGSLVCASAKPTHYETYLRAMHDEVTSRDQIEISKCICGGTFKPTDRVWNVTPPLFEYMCEDCKTFSNRTIDGEEVRPR